MGHRRKAREYALQMLYQLELAREEPKIVYEHFWRSQKAPEEVVAFATQIVDGTFRNLKEIDDLIEKHSTHWKISRMNAVDRNILRLSVYEILFCHDIPVSVAINEGIEIAKKFGTDESSSFVNGVLDHIAKEQPLKMI
ncbi:MAG: transcription antitermination factor NusB [Deltaproteobacteria bacterium RIFCSPLOWO2_02_FULL_50_16]|nr:MAG: transcription antitermination factor NusB [Deltaproteobacteria bacterium GWA2_50_8]OGQ56855.1 MAG: transcription antitermination factor NusB [Deltaproteobacteria bacterium RIFCSPLOWO2_02_FULL_50_16]OGQ67870.1 MAG: transcription antitermination factor NusB [Deltaproteobacteria bacterium RIFCSPLOWO2_12_FULL_50_11]